MKETLWRFRELLITHISFIEILLEEIDEVENLSIQQKERATTLLWSFEGLINLKQLLDKVEENSTGNSAQIMVSEL
jgi:hypothetical protein